jgi:hypothetical protein
MTTEADIARHRKIVAREKRDRDKDLVRRIRGGEADVEIPEDWEREDRALSSSHDGILPIIECQCPACLGVMSGKCLVAEARRNSRPWA